MTIKEALENSNLSLEDEIDYNDTPEGEEIACLRLEIERLNNIINKAIDFINNNCYESGDSSSMYLIDIDKLLEILDKGE